MSTRQLSKGERRREQLLNLVRRQGKITVHEIMQIFGCSEATARRDLEQLESSGGGLIRSVGGTLIDPAAQQGMREVSFQERRELLWQEKQAIAAAAASLVQEGEVIGLTGGTTTYLIARELKHRRGITVVTNALNVAMELCESEDIQVVLAGGVVRRNSYELCGPLAEKIMESLHIGTMFLGVDGITPEGGLMTFSEQEAEIARLMMSRSRQTYAIFDHTKAGRTSLFSIAPLERLHGCITNEALSSGPAALISDLRRLDIEVHLVQG